MIRGLLSGVAWGVLVTGVGIVGLSLATPLSAPSGGTGVASSSPEPVVTPAPLPEASAASEDVAAAPETQTPEPPAQDVVAAEAPMPVELPPVETAPVETAPAEVAALEAEPAVEETAVEEAGAEETAPPVAITVTEAPQAAPSVAPSVTAIPGTDVAVALPQVSVPDGSGTAVAPELNTQSTQAPAVIAAAPRADVPRESGLPQVSQTIDPEAPPPSFQPARLAGEPVSTPQVGIARDTTTPAAPQPAPTPEAAPAAASPEIAPEPAQTVEAPETPEIPAVPEAQVAAVVPRILEIGQAAPGTPAGRLALQGGLVTNGARIGQPVAALVPSVAPAEASPDADPLPEPALMTHAVPFERVSPGTPVVAIVLIDTPESRVDRVTLLGFPFPVTFAVDATQPDAAEAVRSYRANGFEVVLVADGLPQAGTAQDLEIALEGAFQVVDEAVAVMDSQDGFLQNTRVALDTVLGRLQQSGHGFLSFPLGLDAGEAAARRAGVPGRTVYRNLDAEQENSTVITRYLDRATLAAGQEGHAIVVGHTYADTVTAIYTWQQSIRAQAVEVAPVSYVLQQYGRN
jgi:hypothetical protein